MGHDHIGFKTCEAKLIKISKNKHDINAMIGHLQVTQYN